MCGVASNCLQEGGDRLTPGGRQTQNSMEKKIFEILAVEHVGIDTKRKYLESLIRKIFVISHN